jgi:hypothetical protein
VPWAIALGLVLGGALGNLGDRLFRAPGPFQGHVVDMISLFAPYGEQFAVFNIADSCLTVGVVLAVLLELTGRQRDGSRLAKKARSDDPFPAGAGRPRRHAPRPGRVAPLRLSRTAAAHLVEAGDAMVDGVPRPKSDKVAAGSWLEVTLPPPVSAPAVAGRAGARDDHRLQRRRLRGGGQAGRRGGARQPGLDRSDRGRRPGRDGPERRAHRRGRAAGRGATAWTWAPPA